MHSNLYAYLAILVFPFLGFFLAFSLNVFQALGRVRIFSLLASLVTIIGIFVSFLLSWKLFLTHLASPLDFVEWRLADWFHLGFFNYSDPANFSGGRSDVFGVHWGFLFDGVSLTMCVVITSVSLLVHLYAMEYMGHDPARARFMSYLSLFVFFMLILVTANNYLQAFIGWEGVGLVSYLLISFWYMRVEAARSALKAVSMNKIGDFGYVLAMVFLFFHFHTLDYHGIYSNASLSLGYTTEFFISMTPATLVGFFLLVAAAGKSAQLGLHTWLPDAMEGPTPVSALIHAATMVTAGVYLIIRSSPLLSFSPGILVLVTVIGASTALFGASTALFQSDIKKIIAYSTCSQLGYMFVACGLSCYSAAIFHLFTHAFFKALLFLGAGSVIHALADEQDIRRMGGLAKLLPFTYAVFVIGSFALMGLPFLAGYYSKDYILELALVSSSSAGHYAYLACLLAALCTSAYSARLIYLVFYTRSNAHRTALAHVHEPKPAMLYPLVFLTLLSIVGGAFFSSLFLESSFWSGAIFSTSGQMILAGDPHGLASAAKIFPTECVLVVFAFVLVVYHYFNRLFGLKVFRHSLGRTIHLFFNKKWLFDHFYAQYFIRRGYLFFYRWIFCVFERGLLMGTLVGAAINLTLLGVRFFKALQTGYLYHYALGVLAAFALATFFVFNQSGI